MAESKTIENHEAHFKDLLQRAGNDSVSNIKALIDYLLLYKAGEHSEVILEKGITFVQKHSGEVNATNMYLVEEFFVAALELR